MGYTGEYPPTGGWERLIPEKIEPRETPRKEGAMPCPTGPRGMAPKRMTEQEKSADLEKELLRIIKEMILNINPEVTDDVALVNAAMIVANIKTEYSFLFSN